MNEDIKKILNYVEAHRNEYIDYLMMLLSENTTNINHGIDGGYELNGQKFIIEKFKELGMILDIFEPKEEDLKKCAEASLGHNYNGRPNVVGTLKGSGGGKSLLINGHIDTMPFDNIDKWINHPLKPSIHEGKIYARGAADMKGGLVGAMLAVSTLVKCDLKLKGDLVFQSVVDEEGGGNGTISCVVKGYKSDAAIVAEPTELKLMPAHMGWVFFKLEVTGKALHSGMKNEGINAIEKIIKIIDGLNELEKEWLLKKRHPLLPPPTLNIGVIQGGMAGSVVPDYCMMDFGAHYTPNEADENGLGSKIEKEILDKIDLVCEDDTWLKEHKPVIVKYQQGSPFEIKGNGDISKNIANSYKVVINSKPDVVGCVYGCDARIINNYGNIPTIMFGPGSIKTAHAINENIQVEEYMNYIKIMALTIYNWCNDK